MAAVKKKPQTIDDLAPDVELTEAEQAALDGHAQSAPTEDTRSGVEKLRSVINQPGAIVQGAPEWAKVPHDLRIPKDVEVGFFLVPLPDGSDMQIIMWELSVADERLARARADALGPGARLVEEMAKQMMRAIDGRKVDWMNPLPIESAWERMRSKYRNLFGGYYMKMHQLDDTERTDFFANRVVARRSA